MPLPIFDEPWRRAGVGLLPYNLNLHAPAAPAPLPPLPPRDGPGDGGGMPPDGGGPRGGGPPDSGDFIPGYAGEEQPDEGPRYEDQTEYGSFGDFAGTAFPDLYERATGWRGWGYSPQGGGAHYRGGYPAGLDPASIESGAYYRDRTRPGIGGRLLKLLNYTPTGIAATLLGKPLSRFAPVRTGPIETSSAMSTGSYGAPAPTGFSADTPADIAASRAANIASGGGPGFNQAVQREYLSAPPRTWEEMVTDALGNKAFPAGPGPQATPQARAELAQRMAREDAERGQREYLSALFAEQAFGITDRRQAETNAVIAGALGLAQQDLAAAEGEEEPAEEKFQPENKYQRYMDEYRRQMNPAEEEQPAEDEKRQMNYNFETGEWEYI